MSKITMDIRGQKKFVSDIDHRKLHSFILKNVSQEFANLVEDCYYPTFSNIYKELLSTTNSTEKNLVEYSKKKYNLPWAKILHDPKTILLVLIVQEFLSANDAAAALSAFHLLVLRNYSNIMYKFIRHCNPDVFRTALGQLSHNHLFVLKKTIPSSLMYLSNTLFKKYKDALQKDDIKNIVKVVYELRHRINQSVRSFAQRYYDIHSKQKQIRSEEEKEYDLGREKNLRQFIDNISKTITVYKKVDENAAEESRRLTKFNSKLSVMYSKNLSQPQFTEDVSLALFLLLRDVKDFEKINTTNFLDYVKRLMSVKISKQPIYFKKQISKIHDQIIQNLNLVDWYNKLSTQSKSISRNFIAYYLAFYLRNFIS